VVNGVIPVIGSDKSDIDDAISQTRGKAMLHAVQLSASGDKLTVSVPDAKDSAVAKGEVWIYGVTGTVPVTIGKGENAGRKITYYNVARRLVKVGDWTGKAASWTIPADQIRAEGVDGAVAVLQSGSTEKPGLMLGGAFAALR
jgi:hypothetical protein